MIYLYRVSVNVKIPGINRRKYPHFINTLLSRKRCLWKLTRQQQTNLDFALNYRLVTSECKQAIDNFELSKENKVINARNAGAFYKYVNGKLIVSSGVGLLI